MISIFNVFYFKENNKKLRKQMLQNFKKQDDSNSTVIVMLHIVVFKVVQITGNKSTIGQENH